MKKKKFLYLLIIIITLIFSMNIYTNAMTKSISKKVIRFHVLANSNSTEDQALKLKVRDNVVAYTKEILKNSSSLNESRDILTVNIPTIKNIAVNTLALENNYDNVEVLLTTSHFPDKSYGEFTFPEGEYEALKIIIGEGKGNNWWCVMFPPLCFTDIDKCTIDTDSQKLLQENLSKNEIALLREKTNEVKIKFKLSELI